MAAETVEVPAPFAADIVARQGAEGRTWLRELPDVVAGLCADWDLAPDGPVWWGYLAIVVPVQGPDRRPAALKVSWPGPDQAPEALALAALDVTEWSGCCDTTPIGGRCCSSGWTPTVT